MNDETAVIRRPVEGGAQVAVREEFGATMAEYSGETAAEAVRARETAAVQARYIVALQRPRNMEQVRVQLLAECKRPGFAKAARWTKPVGGGKDASGPTIRFAEAAIRCMGNMWPETAAVYETPSMRVVRVSVTDLEANVTYSSEVVIPKTVERRSVKPDQTAISRRTNSRGETTYLIEATGDEVMNRQNALGSKTLRTHALRLLPADITDQCMAQVIATQANEDAKDPEAAKREIIDAFAELGIMPAELQIYLRDDLSRLQPKQLADLRGAYRAIRDGETTWAAIMEDRMPEGSRAQQQAVAERKIAEARGAGASGVPVDAATEKLIPAIPDDQELPVLCEDDRVAWRGDFYEPNADKTAWRKVEPQKPPAVASPPSDAPPPTRRRAFGGPK